MNILTTELPGVVIIEPRVFADSRGYFLETFHRQRYAEAGLPCEFAQDNLSVSRRGTLRGLHYQNPQPQGKLVSVLAGEVFDVAVDIRAGSDTFGRWTSVMLSADNKRQFYIPPGFAHGFCVTSETAVFAYKCTAPYFPQGDGSIRWNDPALDIPWPVTEPLLSDKDRQAPLLSEAPAERLAFGQDAIVPSRHEHSRAPEGPRAPFTRPGRVAAS